MIVWYGTTNHSGEKIQNLSSCAGSADTIEGIKVQGNYQCQDLSVCGTACGRFFRRRRCSTEPTWMALFSHDIEKKKVMGAYENARFESRAECICV